MDSNNSVVIGNLQIAKCLYDLVKLEIAPGTGIDPDSFWASLGSIVRDLEPKNAEMMSSRVMMHATVDAWHIAKQDKVIDIEEYKDFLTMIGYLLPEGEGFQIETLNVDSEISELAGPQLVVPVDNARYALNAANARWGSLFDALYGTDVISGENGAERGKGYNTTRGKHVISFAWKFLDQAVPLIDGKYGDVTQLQLKDTNGTTSLLIVLKNGQQTSLADPSQFRGFNLEAGVLTSILLRNNGLHIDIQIDKDHYIGCSHPVGVKDVVLEAAVTTIQDFEDSVAAVDAEDKTSLYRNWLGLMKGSLEAEFMKDGERVTRKLNSDRTYVQPDGGRLTLPGRSLMLMRNVGLHMYTDAVVTTDNEKIPEGFLDVMISVLIAKHDLLGNSTVSNSRTGSIYLVKPKLHGPGEITATLELFARVEKALGLAPNTIKIGIMDEARRTTVNLKECIRAAIERVIFINTGFMDRTGDEIHNVMKAGPVLPTSRMKSAPWILAYEDWNVDIGIECGFPGKAQIGKGMWAMPDEMKKMVDSKILHPNSGASTAWVPSPTAATLHAMHYHQVNVRKRQTELAGRTRASLDDILTLPLLGKDQLNNEEIQNELDSTAQSILGYVARWVGQGVGCSKVPDISNIGLMEDRATLRISSQLVANWLFHGIVSQEQIIETFEKMARVVDQQNMNDSKYCVMAEDFGKSIEFQAALDLVFKALDSPNGLTEKVLHQRRWERKVAGVPKLADSSKS
ncbi:MAG: malate synthase G [Deltaproteobacteria bacterium]|jgi:malate synthase|nr:malate synthase G [Deltaproteobacteria bacterium]MBT6503649.1 malate synthase G [Deltaproteobacteria bacterium]MBT7152698.1 malate synthase G [Deltaproteobacteria bacterium]MBT7713484.1 malate synthase G [Deltaproteobacteria bacterium]